MEYTTLAMELLRRVFKFLEHILFSTRKSEAMLDSLTNDSLVPLLKSQNVTLLGENIITLLPYQNPSVKACVQEAKFYAHTKATKLLADVLHDFLIDFVQSESAVNHESVVCVPLPLSRARKSARGYNQVEEIVREALSGLEQVTMETAILTRSRDTRAQAKLARAARLTNMINAFSATVVPAEHTIYIVVDDVATTGATLKEAKRALSRVLPDSSRILLLALSH